MPTREDRTHAARSRACDFAGDDAFIAWMDCQTRHVDIVHFQGKNYLIDDFLDAVKTWGDVTT